MLAFILANANFRVLSKGKSKEYLSLAILEKVNFLMPKSKKNPVFH